jgi:ATP-dependent Clp protease ATP-binding subunit ClpB
VDFRNTVIVMTSNLGSQLIQRMSGEENYERMKAGVMEVVGEHFRPEFINRVDDIVVFHPLTPVQLRQIVRIQLGYLRQRLADREMRLELSEQALDRLAEAGFDPVYGARPLKRAIQTRIENPLAQEILKGAFRPGDTIEADIADGELVFRRRKAAAA